LKADVSVRSCEEIAAAISAFTDAQRIRLRKVAEKYAWLYPLGTDDDLLSDAISRALAGTRQCPTNVEVVRFLAEVMRSIADGEASKLENPVTLIPVLQPGDPVSDAVDPIDSGLNAEEKLVAADSAEAFRQAMLGLFPDDPQARDLLDGIMEGYEGEELRAVTNLDETGFASKRRLIRRRIDKNFPEGWKR
jgi:DNA-directed RNA polymerase specialized sigma24 family protein